MFNWFTSHLRKEIDRLRAELTAVKAANSPSEFIADGGAPGLGAPQVNLAGAREQLRHFTGHQYTAISAIAKRVAGQELFVASQPAQMVKTTKNNKTIGNGLESLPSHPLLDAINDPNPTLVRFSLLFVTVASLELTGRAYWWLRDTGERFEIWPLPVDWVTPEHGDRLYDRWKIRPAGVAEPFSLDGEDVAYFSLPDPADPMSAVSPLATQARAVNADESIQEAQDFSFRNGIQPGVAIQLGDMDKNPSTGQAHRPELTNEQRKQLIQAVRRAYAGVTKHREPLILDRLIEKVFPIFANPSEMDFLDSGKQTKSRIFEAYGVNPIIAGQVENANRASSWVAEYHFCVNVINPLLILLGQVLTAWVAPRFAVGGERLTVWFAPAVANDAELELAKWRIGVERGLVTTNEYRRHVLNLPDLQDNELGDELIDPTTATTTENSSGLLMKAWNPYRFTVDDDSDSPELLDSA